MAKKTAKHEDIAGTPIVGGSYVVYAASWGRAATLKVGKVVALVTGKPDPFDDDQRPVPKIQCVTVDRDFDRKWFVQGMGELATNPKPKIVTLGQLDRMMVVPLAMLPPRAARLLDEAWWAWIQEHT